MSEDRVLDLNEAEKKGAIKITRRNGEYIEAIEVNTADGVFTLDIKNMPPEKYDEMLSYAIKKDMDNAHRCIKEMMLFMLLPKTNGMSVDDFINKHNIFTYRKLYLITTTMINQTGDLSFL